MKYKILHLPTAEFIYSNYNKDNTVPAFWTESEYTDGKLGNK